MAPQTVVSQTHQAKIDSMNHRPNKKQQHKVALIGSGNWGSAVATIIGKNVERYPELFHSQVDMYVFEETVEVDGGEKKKLSEVINQTGFNVKYLPSVKLPKTIHANPDLQDAVRSADVLIWCVPHQFVPRTCATVLQAFNGREQALKDAVSISLIKGGVEIDPKTREIELCSDLIASKMGHGCHVLMGANLANEVAEGQFCEATIGYPNTPKEEENAALLKKLFHLEESFQISTVPDVPGVELCGALKNIIALGAGFCDGLGLGSNTKAAIIRKGVVEMKQFVDRFYAQDEKTTSTSGGSSYSRGLTFFESCGIADVITTCFGGRNRKCADAFAQRLVAKSSDSTSSTASTSLESTLKNSPRSAGKSEMWATIEAELLNGQKLQGTLTCDEILAVLEKRNCKHEFPLFSAIYAVAFLENVPVTDFIKLLSSGSSGSATTTPGEEEEKSPPAKAAKVEVEGHAGGALVTAGGKGKKGGM
mmetsp:Transcript_9339/g.22943  ORF Transcript_9339/g.22943 Transcript_9339/m.22943 type:complete len:479 (-) Transcript_9339:1251-2687(-)|eukprot:CAMPEP_0178994078 /NCGR_PEP_ID=MMETSP0795-20121207/7076_1 /TAXON_ID=88552 /ORGANISM="Amoebophrya sp., Strain Ameob2" /LENGTH=478 /DNA_ID=CAMNT_0020686243 /DNA_START=164 /DNA_END=1600 /DNA_ORIENTATION=-